MVATVAAGMVAVVTAKAVVGRAKAVAVKVVAEAARTVAVLGALGAAEVSLVEVGEVEKARAAAEAARQVGWTRGRAHTVRRRRHPRASTLSRCLVRQRSWLRSDRARPRVCGRCE